MASLNEIAYNIKNLAYNGDTNEEENIGIRQIKFWIHYYRAQLIKEESMSGKGVNHAFFQELLIRRMSMTMSCCMHLQLKGLNPAVGIHVVQLDLDA